MLILPPPLSPSLDNLLSEEERLIAEGLDGDKDPGGESFESLFARFSQMKRKHKSDPFSNHVLKIRIFLNFVPLSEHAQSLPHEERKEYAEKVVMAFWNAIGGDEDEIKPHDDKN